MFDNEFFGQFEKAVQRHIEDGVKRQIAAHTRKMDDLVEELRNNKYTVFGMATRFTQLEDENFRLRQRLIVIENQLGITPPKFEGDA